MRVLQRGLLVSLVALCSRVLGLLREIVIVRLFGVSAATDVYYAVFRVPNLVRQLLAEGALSQALMPWLHATRDDPVRHRALMRHLLRAAIGAMLLTLVLGLGTAPWWIHWMLPQPHMPGSAALGMTLWLTCLPYVAAASLSGVLAAVLQAHGHWLGATAAPLCFSLVLIVLPLWLPDALHPGIAVLGWAVLLGGALQLLWLVLALHRARIALRGPSCVLDRSPWWRQVGPALLGVATLQGLALIDTASAARLDAGAVSWLYLAERIGLFPVGLLGAAISLVGLDHLLRADPAQRAAQHCALLRLSLGAGVLAAVAAHVAAPLLVATLYGPGSEQGPFRPYDAAQTIACLQVLAWGLPAVLLVRTSAAMLLAAGRARWLALSAVGCLVLDGVLQVLLHYSAQATATRVVGMGVIAVWCLAGWTWVGTRTRWIRQDRAWILRLLGSMASVTGAALALSAYGVGVVSGRFWPDALHLLGLLLGLAVGSVGIAALLGLRRKDFLADPNA